jgi:hypothetical protein
MFGGRVKKGKNSLKQEERIEKRGRKGGRKRVREKRWEDKKDR